MSTTHDAGDGRRLVAVKGSPAEVLALCDRIANGGFHPLADAERRLVQAENDRMAGAALRVLGVASREDGQRGLVWLGLIGIADPPREGLRELMRDFRRAGIRPVMVTGDQRATARAVGHALELNGNRHLEVFDSTRLDDLESEELSECVSGAQIFSRVNPAQKLKIVRALQDTGAVVAMTGDGINDGPALKAADVGIALGQAGTRVAREVADVILTEDHIQNLLPAIRDGRRVHDNIRKAIHYIAATNTSEVLLVLGSLAAGTGQPLTARQLLWINLISDVFPEIALAVGPAEPGIMRRPPADAWQPVIGKPEVRRLGTQAVVMSGAAMASYLYGISRYGAGARAGSMAFLTLTAAQLLHGLSARSEFASVFNRRSVPPNHMLSVALLGGFAALLLSQFGLASVLGTQRVGLADALVCGGASLASFLTVEGMKGRAPEASALNRLTEQPAASE